MLRSLPQLLRILMLASVFAAGAMVAGCATTQGEDHDEDSDLPWATPESWEGSPLIPGFENR